MVEGDITNPAVPYHPHTPRARRSIHEHLGRPFIALPRNMTRYGFLNNARTGTSSDTVDASVDEVDNVMSKFQRLSPPPIRRNREPTCHSMDESEEEISEDEDDNNQSDVNELHHVSNNIRISNESERSNFLNTSYIPRRQNTSNQKSYIIATLTVVIGILAAYYWSYPQYTNNMSKRYNESTFMCDISDLIVGNDIDRMVLLQIQAGISTIYSKEDTGSFIFVYNSKNKRFNRQKFDRFIKGISRATSNYLRNESDNTASVTEASYENYKTPVSFMDAHRDGVVKSGVLLVRDIDKFPSSLTMAFHYFCDEYNPLVKKSAIFFTLDLSHCLNCYDGKPTHLVVELCLRLKWQTVGKEDIGPLLTRVVNVIVDVTQTF